MRDGIVGLQCCNRGVPWSYISPVTYEITVGPGGHYHGGRRPSNDNSSQSNRHSTIGTRQTDYHEALPSSANVQSHLTSSFANDGNAS